MRISLFRETLASWRLLKNEKEWKAIWTEAVTKVKNRADYNSSSRCALASMTSLIVIFLLHLFIRENYPWLVISMVPMLIIGLYFGNKKMKITDDAAVEIIKNGLTRR